MDAPAFDPAQPFMPVKMSGQPAPAGGPPPFDPTQPFEPVERPSLGERFMVNAREGFSGTSAGVTAANLEAGSARSADAEAIQKVISDYQAAGATHIPRVEMADIYPVAAGQPVEDMPIRDAQTLMQENLNRAAGLRNQYQQGEMQRQADYAATPDSEGVAENLTALGGQLAGGAMTPESLIPVGRGANMLATAGKGAAVNAGANIVTDPLVQGAQQDLGVRDGYDWKQTAISGLIGGVAGGTLNVAPEVVTSLVKRMARIFGKSEDAVTLGDISMAAENGDAEARALMEDPAIKAVMEANNLTPEDPRAQAFAEQVRDRRAAEASREVPPVTEADISRLEAERAAARPAQQRAIAEAPREITGDELVAARQSGEQPPARPVPDVIEAAAPPPSGRPAYSTVGVNERSAGDMAGLGAQRAADADVQRSFDLADTQRRRGPEYEAGRADAEAAFRADQELTELNRRIGEPADVLVERQLSVPRDQFKRLPAEARERLVAAAQRQSSAEAPDPRTLRTSDDAMNAPDEGAPYDAVSTPPRAQERTSQQPAENRAAPQQPTRGELDADGRPYARTATGNSDRPFYAEDSTGRSTPTQETNARAQAQTARAASEEDLIRQWQARQSQDAGRRQSGAGDQKAKESAAYSKKSQEKTYSNEAKPGADSRFETDDFGFVRSTKGGPVRFADQKQAARWILNRGHKTSPDQIFEIENHPSGQGFTVRERGRSETPDVDINVDAEASNVNPNVDTAVEPVGSPRTRETPEATSVARDTEKAAPASPGEAEAAATRNNDVSAQSNGASAQSGRKSDLKSSTTLSANPFGEAARVAWDWGKESVDAWRASIGEFADGVKAMAPGGNLGPVRAALRAARNLEGAVLDSTDGEIRAIAKRFKSKTLDGIVNMFHATAGKAGGVARTFDEAVSTRINHRTSDLARALGPFSKSKDDLRQIVKLVQGGGALDKAKPLHAAAIKLRDMLKDELEYLRKAGVEIGEVPVGYYPRVMNDVAVRKDPEGFQSAAAEAYRASGLKASDALEAAKGLLNEILLKGQSDSLFVRVGGSVNSNFTKGRSFSKAADDIMERFYVTDPQLALAQYLSGTTRRAEIARRFGDGWSKWEGMVANMRAEGAGDAIEPLMRHIRVNAGINPSGITPGFEAALSWTRTWTALMLLEKATLTSLSDALVPALRSGNLADLIRGIGHTAIEAFHGTSKNAVARREMAEDFGLIVNGMNDTILAARFAGGSPSDQLQSKNLQWFFKRTGLDALTRSTRVSAMETGRVFLRRLATDVSREGAGSSWRSTRNSSVRFLGELGIPTEKAADFAKWLAKTDGGMPELGSITGEMGELYRTAVVRFTDQSIMRPSPATRPRWASHALGKVVYQLMSFIQAFQKNVLNRAGRMAWDAATEADLSIVDRARLILPLAMLPILTVVQYGVGEARDLVGDPTAKEADDLTKWMRAGSRAGASGITDPFFNLITGAKYGRDVVTSLVGPGLGAASGGIQAIINLLTNNSDKTNATERQSAKALYDLGIEPSVNFLLGALPASSLLAAGLTQYVGAGDTREKFISALAGEKQTGSGGGGGRGGSR